MGKMRDKTKTDSTASEEPEVNPWNRGDERLERLPTWSWRVEYVVCSITLNNTSKHPFPSVLLILFLPDSPWSLHYSTFVPFLEHPIRSLAHSHNALKTAHNKFHTILFPLHLRWSRCGAAALQDETKKAEAFQMGWEIAEDQGLQTNEESG